MFAVGTNPAILTLLGIVLWAAVIVWDFRATKLTNALFWSRLFAPIIAASLFATALYLLWDTQ